ncbi:hypothetical protein OIU85_025398 [Salix viminalis]|uniref:KIB1-4 beta-propeller domain-containing protein n=1 Tax=Salix viminalis TaxID=40686 RepID=A0A9Q0TLI1_SALVM|nr:hypothetical protein OIU85_025398 [Salix viminalis]
MNTRVLFHHLYRKLGEYLSLSLPSFIKTLFTDRCKDKIGLCHPGVPEGDRVIIDAVSDKLPWLLLPHDTLCESLKFYDLSRNKVHELNLPEVLLGGVSVEVCKGWLVIAKKGQYIRDTNYSSYLSFIPIPDTEIFLFNPLSRAIHQLPSLSTLVPHYYSFVTNCIFNLGGYNVAEFVRRVELSSADPSKSIIALRFNEFEANNCGNLALCRLGDKCWSIFPRETDRDIDFGDILFYNGDFCVLTQKIEHVETHIFKLAEDDEVRIKFIPVSTAARLPFIEAEYWGDNIATIKHALYEPYLVESINGELLIIVAQNVCYAYYDEDDLEDERLDEDEDDLEEERLDEEDDDLEEERLDEEEDDFEHFYDEEDDIEEGDHFERFYFKVSGFHVMEMDPNAGMILRSVQSLSDQLIFLTSGGRSVSVPADNLPSGIQRNCIFFLENDNYFSEVFDAFLKREELLLRRVSRESGICYLESGRIERLFPSSNRLLKCKVGWFTPTP